MLKSFEPDSMVDYLLIPIGLIKYAFAFIINYFTPDSMRSRVTDWTPVICERCMWAGPCRWTIHTYTQIDIDDVCPVNECPRCGAEI